MFLSLKSWEKLKVYTLILVTNDPIKFTSHIIQNHVKSVFTYC